MSSRLRAPRPCRRDDLSAGALFTRQTTRLFRVSIFSTSPRIALACPPVFLSVLPGVASALRSRFRASAVERTHAVDRLVQALDQTLSFALVNPTCAGPQVAMTPRQLDSGSAMILRLLVSKLPDTSLRATGLFYSLPCPSILPGTHSGGSQDLIRDPSSSRSPLH